MGGAGGKIPKTRKEDRVLIYAKAVTQIWEGESLRLAAEERRDAPRWPPERGDGSAH